MFSRIFSIFSIKKNTLLSISIAEENFVKLKRDSFSSYSSWNFDLWRSAAASTIVTAAAELK